MHTLASKQASLVQCFSVLVGWGRPPPQLAQGDTKPPRVFPGPHCLAPGAASLPHMGRRERGLYVAITTASSAEQRLGRLLVRAAAHEADCHSARVPTLIVPAHPPHVHQVTAAL